MNKYLLGGVSSLGLMAIAFDAYGQAVVVSIPNNTSTGTTIGALAKLTSAPSTATVTTTTDVSGIAGVVVGWTGVASTSGNALIATTGIVSGALIDGVSTAGDYLINSPVSGGYLHDAGSNYYSVTSQIVGRALITTAGSGLTEIAMGLATPFPFGTNVAGAAESTLSSIGGLTSTIASGQIALGTSAIASGACASLVSGVATNVLNTDTLTASFSGSPIAQAGFLPGSMLSIVDYPSANAVNFYECNNTSSSITPAALSINWKVVR